MGKTLLKEITENTGLPEQLIQDELQTLIASAGIHSDSVTLDDLRRILAEYMQEVLVAAKEDLAG